MEEKRTIVTLPSGTIDLVFNQFWVALQFNVADCRDALPYCHAMCCRALHIPLSKEEEPKFDYVPHPFTKQPILLRTDMGACNYLQQDCKCGVHTDKPDVCKRFHCSPGGAMNDPDITRRDAGWMLSHVKHEEAELVQIELENKNVQVWEKG